MIKIISKIKVENIAVIVLAGGESSRMNFPKPWLIFNNNTTFLETITSNFNRAGFKKIVISLNKSFFLTEFADKIEFLKLNATIVQNNFPEKGRLYSLYIALKELKTFDFVFIQNVDNPFIDEEVLNVLYKERIINGTTIPSFNGKSGHPIIISKIIMDEIINNYEKYNTLKDIINRFGKKYIAVDSSKILININTPLEYNKMINELV